MVRKEQKRGGCCFSFSMWKTGRSMENVTGVKNKVTARLPLKETDSDVVFSHTLILFAFNCSANTFTQNHELQLCKKYWTQMTFWFGKIPEKIPEEKFLIYPTLWMERTKKIYNSSRSRIANLVFYKAVST